MQVWIIGLTFLSVLVNEIPVSETTPIGSSFGSRNAFRPNSEQHAEFGEGIRDWFRNVKNRIFGGTNEQVLPPPEAGKMMMELENEDLEDRKRYPGGFFLDLSNLTFDPETDWGFRLSHWYFIRKPYDVPIDDWKLSHPTYPEWPTIEDDRDDSIVPPLITLRPNNDATIPETSMPGKDTPEVTETEVPIVKDEDNETRSSKEDYRSTEVLLPSE